MSAKTKPRRLWTEKEDEILRAEATRQLALGSLNTWTSIAAKLPSRTNKDCRKRWSKICTNVNRGAWTEEEDSKLLAAVDKHGCSWTQVAMVVGTRHADQCSKRWQHSLDPSLDRSKWKPEEYARLERAVQEHGRSWKVIAEKEFPGRSNSDLKNRYGILEKKSLADRGSRAESLLPVDSSNKLSAAESNRTNNPKADQLQWDFDIARGSASHPNDDRNSSEVSAQADGQDDSCDEMDDEDMNQFNEMEFDVNMDMYLDQRNDFDLSATSTSLPFTQTNTSEMLMGDIFQHCSNFEMGDPGPSSCGDQMSMESIEAMISGNDIAWTPKPDYVFSPNATNEADNLMNLPGIFWEAEDNNLDGDQQAHGEQPSQETRTLQNRNSKGKRDIDSANRQGELSYSQQAESLSLNAVQDGDNGGIEGFEQRNRTTLVLDDVQPGTLSRIMNILIQDKIKLKLESQQ